MSAAAPTSPVDDGEPSRSRTRLVGYDSLRRHAELEDQHRQLRRAASGVTLGLLLVCILVGSIAYSQTERYRELLGARLAERNELRAVQAALGEAEIQIDSLVRGRIPGLHPVRFDEVLPLEDQYVRNLVFTLARTSEGVSYEYKVVLHNGSDVLVIPDFAIHVFDRFGAEIGRAQVASPEAQPAKELVLYPEEVRSYAAAIPLPRDRTPAYFRLQFD